MVVSRLCADRDFDFVGGAFAAQLAPGKSRCSRSNSGVNRRVNQYRIAHSLSLSPLSGHVEKWTSRYKTFPTSRCEKVK
jgi:hypothetical protein